MTSHKTTGDNLESLRESGYTLIEGVIPADKVESVREAVETTVDSPQYQEGGRDFLACDQQFVKYVGDSRVNDVVGSVLGEYYRVSFTNAIIRQSHDKRGAWHSDWPFGSGGAAFIPEPFPDAVMYLTTVWMLTPFSTSTGGTLIIPGSHKWQIDPLGGKGPNPSESHPEEIHVSGKPGDVMIFDSRMWHAKPNNDAAHRRVAMRVCFAPWWLNLDVLDPESIEGQRMAAEAGANRATSSPPMPKISNKVFDNLPENVKPLYYHWVQRQQ